MTATPTRGRALPAGLDARWSTFVDVADATGATRTWHVLDNGARPTTGTLLCLHGNPTWSFLWRRFLAAAPDGWRVLAPDQLGMGLSDRPAADGSPAPRRLAQRIDDLGDLTAALDVGGPVVVLAHDWGGPVSLGWALRHRAQLAGLVLTNTAVSQPDAQHFSGLIRLARSRPLHALSTVRTDAFVRGATLLSRRSLAPGSGLPAEARDGLAAPYRAAADRQAVGDFVADVPLERDHPSRSTLDAVADGVRTLADVPALLLWGARDPVFTDVHLADLLARLPQADVHRFPLASHLVTEDAPETVQIAWEWIGAHAGRPVPEPVEPPLLDPSTLPWATLLQRVGDPTTAVTEIHGGTVTRTSFGELERRSRDLAAGLVAAGVRPGERVALLVPPGPELTVAVYGVWRAGASIVVADAGLGVRGMAHALRSAAPDHLVGIGKALLAMGALRVPGRRFAVGGPEPLLRGLPGVTSLAAVERRGAARPTPEPGRADREAAVLFTSGATGPAKGVVYRLSQLSEQVRQVASVLRLAGDARLVAAFAPFALYGPAIGVPAAVPDMDVTRPGTLTAAALATAVAAVDATSVFASPAALRNVVATADALTDAQRSALAGVATVLSAGAPVPVRLLRRVAQVLPNASLHTPYGMTELLPATDVSLAELEEAGPGHGTCVGRPLPGVRVAVVPLDAAGRADGEPTDAVEVTGEILLAAAHRKERYDRLWDTERQSSRNPGWHRTGDAGHLDAQGRLWVEGRMVHVVSTADGPVTPVGLEQRLEGLDQVTAAAVVGVGPVGTQALVAVLVPSRRRRPESAGPLAGAGLAAAARAAVAPHPLAAVLLTDALPTDIRHASKVDRTRLARWAARLLSGQRAGSI